MHYPERKIDLKDGREATLRSAREEDAAQLLQYLKATAGETAFLTREPEEVNMTLEKEKAFIKKVDEGERELMLLAFVDGRHAGNCSLTPAGSFLRFRHRCVVAIALYQEFWGLGLGRQMLETILKEAAGWGYEQAELEVANGNDRAIALYESLGFRRFGTLPRNMKYADGSYRDVHWMMLELEPRTL